MTVRTTGNHSIHRGNGATTSFPFHFKVLEVSDLVIERRVYDTKTVDKVYGPGEFTVQDLTTTGGTVKLSLPIASTHELSIMRRVDYTQELDIVNQGGFYPEEIEKQLDHMVMQTQQIAAGLDRTIKVPVGETGTVFPAVGARAGRFAAFDAVGNPIAASGTGADGALRTDLADETQGGKIVAIMPRALGAVKTTSAEVLTREVNVMDGMFEMDKALMKAGASVDIAYAINKVTGADLPWSSDLQGRYRLPDFPCRIGSTTFWRNGQKIQGAGHGTEIDCVECEGPAFQLGMDSFGSTDPYGPPVEVEGIRTMGSSLTDAVIDVRVPGVQLRNMFISSPNIGLNIIKTSELTLSDITIEQYQLGLQIQDSRNFTSTNLILWDGFEGMRFGSDCYDMSFTGGGIYYPRYHGIYFNDQSVRARGIDFHNMRFIMNSQSGLHAGFQAMVRYRASDVQAGFYNCTFRNWRNYAILQDSGDAIRTSFYNCVFDGEPTDNRDPAIFGVGKGYSHSTTSKVMKTTGNGDWTFVSPKIYNCKEQPFELGSLSQVLFEMQSPIFAANVGGSEEILLTNNNPLSQVKITLPTYTRPLVSASPGPLVRIFDPA